MIHTLRLILGDQLNEQHPWFSTPQEGVLYVLMECRSETDYVRHHIQKVVGFFLAMRTFKTRLQELGHNVHYITLDDAHNKQSVPENILHLVNQFSIQQVEYIQPDEYRLTDALKGMAQQLSIPVRCVDSAHFMSTPDEFSALFKGKKIFLMESFYRAMRVKWNLLMEEDGKTPIGGKWNYDSENRKRLPASVRIPPEVAFKRDVQDVVLLLEQSGVETIGRIDASQFNWPITRAEALQTLDHFLEYRLPYFGTFQDAMTVRHTLLFHSKLSFSLNLKLLSPLEVVQAAIAKWKAAGSSMDIAQVEGFVRQIIGWREYVRGIYWAKMPTYATLNYFEHTRALPSWFWTGQTNMRCLSHAINQSLDTAYAHHIQRLMVTGNFALLIGANPDEIDAWYLGIYIDALEWVEMPNTRGMSQFADGGIVGTKPYVSSANYIHKMSDYCTGCKYDATLRHGPKACPFNSLYWHFYHIHADKLKHNPRIGMAYRLWEKMAEEERTKTLSQAVHYLKEIEAL